MKIKLSGLPIAFLAFFIFLGYLEAGWIGAVAGLVFPLLASYLLPIALIPFAGVVIWWLVTKFLLSNILHFLPVAHLFIKVMLFYLVWAVLINIATTVVLIIMLLLMKRFIKSKVTKKLEITWSDIEEIINYLKDGKWKEAIELVWKLLDKLDLKFIGSALFWLGIGVASHDFWWEASEGDVDVERPTHGTWLGLEIAGIGLQITCIKETFIDKFVKMIYYYIGFSVSMLGFISLSFLPKGVKRIISHVLWWSGITLMVYNWYLLIQDRLSK